MSFGYSISEFLAVVQLAFSLYEKCRSSTSVESRELAGDVGNAHFVLRKVHDFWAYEKRRGQDLLIPQLQELEHQAEALKEALEEVEEIYQRDNDPGAGGPFIARVKSRSKYVLRELYHTVGSARVMLQRYTGSLALFHTMLIVDSLRRASGGQKEALSSFKEEADIIQAFVITYIEFQDGKRKEPAYFQAARKSKSANREEQANEVVEAAEEDLLAENIDKDVISRHLDVAKEWLEIVIIGDDDRDAEEDDFAAESTTKGLKRAAGVLTEWYKQGGSRSMSSLWSLESTHEPDPSNPRIGFSRRPFYRHAFAGDIPVGAYPLERNMTNAIYLATDYCVKQINSALDGWQKYLEDWSADEKNEVLEALNAMIDIAAKFHSFDSDKGLDAYHWMDDLLDYALLIPIPIFTELRDAPFEVSKGIRDDLWAILDRMLGLVFDLGTSTNTSTSDWQSGPPVLAKWRELRMLDRARQLFTLDPELWTETTAKEFDDIKWWYQQHQNIKEKAVACVKAAEELRDEQQKIFETRQVKKILLGGISVETLAKDKLRRPSTYCTISVDGSNVYKTAAVKSLTPTFLVYDAIPVTRSSIVTVSLYSESQKSPLGQVDFDVKENVDFTGNALVNVKKVMEIKSSKPVTVKFTVCPSKGQRDVEPFSNNWEHADLTEEEKARKKISELPLPSFILTKPIPKGWAVRRCGEKDCMPSGVYFYQMATSKATAVLWYDPFYSIAPKNDLYPLPDNWEKVEKGGKMVLQKKGGISFVGTQASAASAAWHRNVFVGVIRPVRYYTPEAFGL